LELLKTGLGLNQSLVKIAEHHRVQRLWISSHREIEGNETANQLARLGSERSFIGPEPACGISAGVVKKIVRDWTEREKKSWECITGLRHAKGFLQGPSFKRTRELLKLNKNQLRWSTGLFTEHCHLKDTFLNWD
jgi:hypothetical protein